MATVNRNVIKVMLIRNELGGKGNINLAYRLRHAPIGQSGYSFGQAQWDLSKDPEIDGNGFTASDLLEDILTNATDSTGNLIVDANNIEAIMAEVAKKDGNISTYKDSIEKALQSEYGKQEINDSFDTYVDYTIGRIDNMVAELRDYSSQLRDAGNTQKADWLQRTADYIDNTPLIQAELIDMLNQQGIKGIDSIGNFTDENDGKLLEYLKDGETTINNGILVKMDGNFDMVDYLKFLFNTKHGYNNLEDVLRRQSNIIDEASKNGMWGDDLTDLNILVSEAYKAFGSIKDLFLRNKEINDSFNRYFTRATQWRPSREPLTLDLDGDGIETVGINTNNPILFDHNADGVKTATGWVKPDDGMLVMDRNNNGVIDNGRELFGDSTQLSAGGNAADGFAERKQSALSY